MWAEETHRLLKSQNFIEGFSLGQALIKIKHDREMVGKICPNMKLTPLCTPLP